MDHFHEEVVVKKNRTLNNVVYALLWLVMIVSLLFAVMSLYSIGTNGTFVMPIILLLVNGGIAFLIWIKKDNLRLEYEYTFTNGELDFASVMGNRKRKNLGTMHVKNVEACGYVAGEAFPRYINMKDLKRMNWFLNRGADLFYFFYQKDGKKNIIIIEPTEELVDMIRVYLPQGVFQK